MPVEAEHINQPTLGFVQGHFKMTTLLCWGTPSFFSDLLLKFLDIINWVQASCTPTSR